jgi:hypothetical protein
MLYYAILNVLRPLIGCDGASQMFALFTGISNHKSQIANILRVHLKK